MRRIVNQRILEILRNDALAYRVYSIANQEDWSYEKFLEELAIAISAAREAIVRERVAAELRLPILRLR